MTNAKSLQPYVPTWHGRSNYLLCRRICWSKKCVWSKS